MRYIIGVQNLRTLFIMEEEMHSVEVVEVWKVWHGARGHFVFLVKENQRGVSYATNSLKFKITSKRDIQIERYGL